MARLKENDTVLDKWVITSYEYPTKPELGDKSVWHFDRSKNPNGCFRVDHTPTKGEKLPKVQVNKTQTYGGIPVAIVFKTSKNSNAKTKMKQVNGYKPLELHFVVTMVLDVLPLTILT